MDNKASAHLLGPLRSQNFKFPLSAKYNLFFSFWYVRLQSTAIASTAKLNLSHPPDREIWYSYRTVTRQLLVSLGFSFCSPSSFRHPPPNSCLSPPPAHLSFSLNIYRAAFGSHHVLRVLSQGEKSDMERNNYLAYEAALLQVKASATKPDHGRSVPGTQRSGGKRKNGSC